MSGVWSAATLPVDSPSKTRTMISAKRLSANPVNRVIALHATPVTMHSIARRPRVCERAAIGSGAATPAKNWRVRARAIRPTESPRVWLMSGTNTVNAAPWNVSTIPSTPSAVTG